MRKSFLKTMVATAIVGATMAITSIAAMAATVTYDFIGKTAFPVTGSDDVSTATGVTAGASGGFEAFKGTYCSVEENAKGLKFNAQNNSDFSSKNHVQINVAANDKVYIYATANAKAASSNIYIYDDTKRTTKIGSAVVPNTSADKFVLAEYVFDMKDYEGPIYITCDKKADTTNTSNLAIASITVVSDSVAPVIADGQLNGVVDSKPAIVKSNDVYYAIALVSEQAATDNQELAIVTNVPGSTANTKATTKEVFTMVTLDNTYSGFGASRFGNGADYAYAVELSGCEGKTLQEVQDVLSLSFTVND